MWIDEGYRLLESEAAGHHRVAGGEGAASAALFPAAAPVDRHHRVVGGGDADVLGAALADQRRGDRPAGETAAARSRARRVLDYPDPRRAAAGAQRLGNLAGAGRAHVRAADAARLRQRLLLHVLGAQTERQAGGAVGDHAGAALSHPLSRAVHARHRRTARADLPARAQAVSALGLAGAQRRAVRAVVLGLRLGAAQSRPRHGCGAALELGQLPATWVSNTSARCGR